MKRHYFLRENAINNSNNNSTFKENAMVVIYHH